MSDNIVVELIELVAEILDLPEEEMNAETRFLSLGGWDSLNSLRLFSQIEQVFNAKLDLSQYSKVQTIGELAQMISLCCV